MMNLLKTLVKVLAKDREAFILDNENLFEKDEKRKEYGNLLVICRTKTLKEFWNYNRKLLLCPPQK